MQGDTRGLELWVDLALCKEPQAQLCVLAGLDRWFAVCQSQDFGAWIGLVVVAGVLCQRSWMAKLPKGSKSHYGTYIDPQSRDIGTRKGPDDKSLLALLAEPIEHKASWWRIPWKPMADTYRELLEQGEWL